MLIECPGCHGVASRVLASRGTNRRRQCTVCLRRFTTKEIVVTEAEYARNPGRPYRSDDARP
jgi:transcriptional regulator NrdR family protein